jgi:hypothetical protein
MRRLWILLALPGLFGCPSSPANPDDDDSADDDDAADDDDTAAGPFPLVADLDPGQNEPAHPGNEPIRATFNIPPADTSDLALFAPGDLAVAGALTRASGDRELVFTPDESLAPETTYSARLSWNHPDSPLVWSFTTSDAGNGLDDPPDLVGRTYLLALRDANITEPPNIGALLDGFLPEEPIVVGVSAESDFSPAAQPGLHVHGAVAATAIAPYYQDPCQESFPLTYGPDAVLGTLDDRPADFQDPRVVIGPSSLSMTVQNVELNLRNLVMDGFWTPDLSALVLDSFTAVLDTRSLSAAINPAGGDGVACDLLWEAANIQCEDCIDGLPYCVTVRAADMELPEQADQPFAPRGCAEIIDAYQASGACPLAAAAYDPNGNGAYPLCPGWTGR